MQRSYRGVTAQTLHYLIRPHTGVPRQPIASAAAWRGADLVRRPEWSETLSADELAEVEAGLERLRADRRELPSLRAEDLPLARLRSRIAGWRETLSKGTGVVILRGLPTTRWSQEDCERFFFLLGLHLGTPGCQNRDEELLGHVRDQGVSYGDPSVRGYKTTAHLSYHCDAADVVGLLCLRTAASGGRSRFTSSVTVWNELCRRRPDLAARLFRPLELDTRGDGGVLFVPVIPCRYAGGQLRTFYHADYFRSAQQHPGARPLGPIERELLDLYDEIASTPGLHAEMDFAPGDVQLLSNHTVLHARTAYVDHAEPERKRHLLRLWLSLSRSPMLREGPSMLQEGARLIGALLRARLRDRGRVPRAGHQPVSP